MGVDPCAVFEAQLDAVTGGRWDTVAELYAKDAVVEQPFAKPRALRLEGRDQIREHFAAAARLPIGLRARRLEIRRTTDPEVIVAECDYDVTVTATDTRLTVHNIFVVRVRDGKIVWSRDYHDHAKLVEAMDHPIA